MRHPLVIWLLGIGFRIGLAFTVLGCIALVLLTIGGLLTLAGVYDGPGKGLAGSTAGLLAIGVGLAWLCGALLRRR
jgi:hypothetical protein